MTVKLLTDYHLEFLSFKRGCTGSSESTHVKMPHCWKPHVAAHYYDMCLYFDRKTCMKLKTLTGPQISFLCRVYKKVK